MDDAIDCADDAVVVHDDTDTTGHDNVDYAVNAIDDVAVDGTFDVFNATVSVVADDGDDTVDIVTTVDSGRLTLPLVPLTPIDYHKLPKGIIRI